MGKIKYLYLLLFVFIYSCNERVKEEANIVNDITQLNPIKVRAIITPTSVDEIKAAVKHHKGPISIGGGRFSMGGQTATSQALQLDMRKFNQIVAFSKERREITVQSGIRWRELIQFIDKYDLSVKVMQSYSNFTVGGSLSVNVHGRYVGEGAIISTVKQIKMVLANGDVVMVSPTLNKELFAAVVGGYGGLGVIAEITLELTNNSRIERLDTIMNLSSYASYFQKSIRNNEEIIFHNTVIYPNSYRYVRAISHVKTTKGLTLKSRLKPINKKLFLNRLALRLVSGSSFGKWIRRSVMDPIFYAKNQVAWRNYEATYDVNELDPGSRKKETYVLQEYFIPIAQFDKFYPKMVNIFKKHEVNVMNVSIRHAVKDSLSAMAWAKEEVFAFVIYYKQGVSIKDNAKVKSWTNELINASLSVNGSYYLPYQIIATPQQFNKAYPNAKQFFKLKKKYDPDYKFRNQLFDAYYKD
ncbi:MAG: FAD-binding oxidoreductase [Bacteroidota bacterium]